MTKSLFAEITNLSYLLGNTFVWVTLNFLSAVSVLAFYSYDPSSNPLKSTDLFYKLVEKTENKHKEAGYGPFLKNPCLLSICLTLL